MVDQVSKQLLLAVVFCAVLLPFGVRGQARVEFEAAELTVREMAMSVNVCVIVTQGSVSDSGGRVTLVSAGLSATAGSDFTPFDSLRVTFSPGDIRLCRPFNVRVDGNVEGTETVEVTLTSSDFTVGPINKVVISILDDDRITLGLSATEYFVVEGGGRTVDVCAVRITGDLSRELTVTFTALETEESEGNATSGPDRTDYFSGPVEEALEAGNSQVCVPFGTIDDNDSPILEDIEFYQVSLSTNDNVDIVPELEIANVFIEDGDAATVRLERTSISIVEGNEGESNLIEVCVVLEDILDGLERELVFTLSVTLGTAENDDFSPMEPQTIVFPSDSTVGSEQCVEYQTIGDDIRELDETFTVNLVGENMRDNITGAAEVSVTIQDDMDVRQLCEMLTAPDNGDISVPSLLDGSFATYTCILGYILVGDSSRECLTNPDGIEEGDWSGDAPICRIADCGDPPEASANGVVDFTDTTYWSEANYSCPNSCYRLVPDVPTLTCQASEQWQPSTASVCELIDCGAPPVRVNCTITSPMTGCGSMAIYSPLDPEEIRIFGDTTLMCGVDGIWQADPGEDLPFCIPIGICPVPPTPIDNECTGEIEVPGFTSLEADAVADYSCPVGCDLNPVDATSRTCVMINITTGFWSGETPACDGVMCPSLPDPEDGRVFTPSIQFQAVATYVCDDGFMVDTAASIPAASIPACSEPFVLVTNATRVCEADGEWSDSIPSCVQVECCQLEEPGNGSISMDANNPGDTATYSCNDGFTLVGSTSRVCQNDGQWTDVAAPPICYADCEVDTGAVGFNGTRDTDAMTHGTTVIYSCTSDMCTGTRICFDGVWNGTLPSCPDRRCDDLTPTDEFEITHADNPVAGTIATYSCDNGIVGGEDTRVCRCDATWSEPVPECDSGDSSDDFPIWAIIVIAIGGAVLLVILAVLLICCIAYCVRSRKDTNDKQLDNYYRDFMRPYSTPYNSSNPEGGAPVVAATHPRREVQHMEKEMLQSEHLMWDEEEDDDELPSPTPSNEDMEEYRLRLHAVESGSQRRVKSQIVAEKVEVEI